MKSLKIIQGLSEIIDNYDVFLLDQWGVMHDGYKGYKSAIHCVQTLYELNKKIIIISNSSRKKNITLNNLPKLGFNPENFFEVMTSGEMIWQKLKKNINFISKKKNKCYYLDYLYKKKTDDYIADLQHIKFVNSIKEADFILATRTSPKKKTIDYIPLLVEALNKNLLFICANPDYETIENKSKKLVICMGTIAELYKNLGGKTLSLGKPQKDIYIESTKKIQNLDKSKILAIGDSIYHDIKGAKAFGIDSVLISSGIHKSSFDSNKPEWNTDYNIIKESGIVPEYLCKDFCL